MTGGSVTASFVAALLIAGGAALGCLTAVAGALMLGLDTATALAPSTKSVIAPFAVTIMGAMRGIVRLAAASSVATGAHGALLLPPLWRWLG